MALPQQSDACHNSMRWLLDEVWADLPSTEGEKKTFNPKELLQASETQQTLLTGWLWLLLVKPPGLGPSGTLKEFKRQLLPLGSLEPDARLELTELDIPMQMRAGDAGSLVWPLGRSELQAVCLPALFRAW
ncbi:Prolow-Density Lipoprotein Receptor-Related Protein 1 [Manis pentadactyla]|nr:Prolow-Density Lipoprotein Receptor-Related Protein 1 [Manis pentadactyla]